MQCSLMNLNEMQKKSKAMQFSAMQHNETKLNPNPNPNAIQWIAMTCNAVQCSATLTVILTLSLGLRGVLWGCRRLEMQWGCR